MSVPDILEAFQRAAAAGALTADDRDGIGIGALLAGLHTERLSVIDGAVGRDATSVWLVGSTTFPSDSTVWALRLIGCPVPASERAVLTLDLTLLPTTRPWTFGGAFGALRDSRRPMQGGTNLILGPSVIAPLVLESPVITATNEPAGTLPRLAGALPLRGRGDAPDSDLLSAYVEELGEVLPVEGTFDITDGALVLQLRGVAPGMSIPRPPWSDGAAWLGVAAVGIELTTTFPDPTLTRPEPRSTVLLFADVAVPTNPPRIVTLRAPLLMGDFEWLLDAVIDDPLHLEGGIQALMAVVGVDGAGAFALPPGIPLLRSFGLSEVGIGVVPSARGGPRVSVVRVGLDSLFEPNGWDPPVPYLTIDRVGTLWQFVPEQGRDRPGVTGSIYGTMRLGAKPGSSLGATPSFARRRELGLVPGATEPSVVAFTVVLKIPGLQFTASTDQPFSLQEALGAFFGGVVAELPDLQVDRMDLVASLVYRDFRAGLALSGDLGYTVGRVTFTFETLKFNVVVSQSSVSGFLYGLAHIGIPGQPPIELMARAEYPGAGAWSIEAEMRSPLPVHVPELVYALMDAEPPAWVTRIGVELVGLSLSYSTAYGNPFTAVGSLAVSLPETLLGIVVRLELTAEVKRALRSPANEHLAIALRETGLVTPETVVTGSLTGSFSVGRLVVSASVSVTDAGRDYTFAVLYRDLSVTAATAWVGTAPDAHQVVTIGLNGTVGDLVTYLVELANPNANYRLEPPWDFLNSIDLSGLSLIVDPTLQTVAVTYAIEVDLGFVAIHSVGVRYDPTHGTPRVEFVLDAEMLGDEESKQVVWGVIDESPPAVPGQGSELLDLRYVGLGQHVAPKGLTEYTDISTVVDALVATMRPVDPATGKPPIDPAKLVFEPTSQWLFAIDAVVMETVALKVVFHDPDLYGLLISLSGPGRRPSPGSAWSSCTSGSRTASGCSTPGSRSRTCSGSSSSGHCR